MQGIYQGSKESTCNSRKMISFVKNVYSQSAAELLYCTVCGGGRDINESNQLTNEDVLKVAVMTSESSVLTGEAF